jgi:crossover junction endodeoxyribonuclease RuvC
MKTTKRIIGIDPALCNTGWAVIDSSGNERKYVASGVIKPDTKLPLAERLALIFTGIGGICDKYKPDECAIEITFVNKNPTTTLLLGHGRAASIVAVGARKIPVFEYEATNIKKAIGANGHADKAAVANMVKILLPAAQPKSSDESDAIAIALGHSNTNYTLKG